MPSNMAAWLTAARKPLEIKQTPYSTPKPDQVVIRNRAVAVNPIDWILQDVGTSMNPMFPKLPFILGNDVAGEVVEVGSSVTRFKKGDRVVGHAVGVDPKIKDAAQGGFQLYTVLLEHMASHIPDRISFEEASVLPLGLSTAACGLFETDQLALPYPSTKPEKAGKILLIWGGSTSVGCNAVQLAAAAGYDVFTTASPRNFDLLRSLGATKAFDYNDPAVIDKIVKAMEGRKVAGALAMGHNSYFRCIDVLSRCQGEKKVAIASYPGPATPPKRFTGLTMVYYMITGNIRIMIRAYFAGVKTSTVFGSTLVHSGVGKAVYEQYLPQALEKGSFVAAPEPMVVGDGLETLQRAMDLQKKGVSAKKIVVTLK